MGLIKFLTKILNKEFDFMYCDFMLIFDMRL